MPESLDRLRSEVADLENQAGISEKLERASEGPLETCGVLEDDDPTDPVSSRNRHSVDQWDYERRHVRAAYFQIPDIETRKILISARRRIDSEYERLSKKERAEVWKRLAMAHLKIHSGSAWMFGALTVVLGIAGGAYIGHSTDWLETKVGAILGLGVGVILGLAVKSSRQSQLMDELDLATQELKMAHDKLLESKTFPRFFSSSEASTGCEDVEFSVRSALEAIRQRADDRQTFFPD